MIMIGKGEEERERRVVCCFWAIGAHVLDRRIYLFKDAFFPHFGEISSRAYSYKSWAVCVKDGGRGNRRNEKYENLFFGFNPIQVRFCVDLY